MHSLDIKTAGDLKTLWLTQLLPRNDVVSADLVLDSTLMTCQMCCALLLQEAER